MNVGLVKSIALAIVLIMIASALVVMTPSATASDAPISDVATEDSVETALDEVMTNDQTESLQAVDHSGSMKNTRVFVETSSVSELDNFMSSHGLEPTGKKTNLLGVYDVTVPEKLISGIQSLPSVKKISSFISPVFDSITPDDNIPTRLAPQPTDSYTVEEHHATQAWDLGYDGTGVQIAILDTGVDFGHPDLQGRQARENNPMSPYDSWPIVFDVGSVGTYYDSGATDGTWFADTSTQVWKMGDYVYFDGYRYDVSEIPTAVPYFLIGYHPDQNLRAIYGEPVAVLVAASPMGVNFDTVYVDLLNDKTFNNDKPCTKGDEISYFDAYNSTSGVWDASMWNAGDGIADVSGGMIYWISDGMNPPPLTDSMFMPPYNIPNQGTLICFVGEFNYGQSHGTGTSSSAVGTGRTMDGLLAGMAPGATIIAVPTDNGGSIIDSWFMTILGYDGIPGTGDEAQIASNSYGWDSLAIDSGNDIISAYNYAISILVPTTTWLWSTGNGGPGYGTSNAVTHPLAIQVGAAASMGYRYLLGSAATDDEMYGDVIPFSDHGPSRAGKLDTDIIAAGAWGFTPAPLYEQLGMPWDPDGNSSWMTFGGTSMSCPVAAGALAVIMQAYASTHGGNYPTNDVAKSLLMSSADDVNHDVLKQGAGFINVERGVKLAANIDGLYISTAQHAHSGVWVADNEWYPGGFNGTNWLTYPDVVAPGYAELKTFDVENHNATSATIVTVTDAIFQKKTSQDLSYTTTGPGAFFLPISSYIPASTDLVRVTAYCSYDDYFDPGRTYTPNFNYGLELHDWIDLNSDGTATYSEFNRITVDGGTSNILQVTMHDPISRMTDGLFLRMTVYFGGQAGIQWHFKIDNYEKVDWSWISEVLGTLNIPASGSVGNAITLTVPANAKVGTYEGAVYLANNLNGEITTLPILVHVAASGPEFEFGGNILGDTIFDNNVSGLADREWRAEVGDWRSYYFVVPDSYVIGSNDKLYITANWSDVPTDIDVHMVTNVSGPLLFNDEPGHLQRVAGSEEYYLGAGNFGFRTTTGGAQEIVAVPFMIGLNEIVLRCPIGAGMKPYEQITGFTQILDDSVMASPPSFNIALNIPAVDPVGEFPISVFTGGLSGKSNVPFGAMTFGPVGGYAWTNLDIYQNDYTYQQFELRDSYDYVKITTNSVVFGMDIDLYVYWFDPSISDWILVGVSAGASSSEAVMLSYPEPGTYEADVFGYSVPGGGPEHFDLGVEFPIPGTMPFGVADVPAIVNPWSSYQFNVTFDLSNIASVYTGYVSFGFLGSKNTFRIPISIRLIDMGAPVLEPIYPKQGEDINDPTPLIQVYFNDTAAYSGVGLVIATLDDLYLGSLATMTGDIIAIQTPILLEDGPHTLMMIAADGAGNLADTLILAFNVDTESYLDVWMEDSEGSIPNGGVTTESPITVTGFAENDSTVLVNGISAPVNPLTGEFSEIVSLSEGPNSITVRATDGKGNTATVSLMVTLDTSVYLFVVPIESPTSLSNVTVSGMVESGSTVLVNANPVTVTNGMFSTVIQLTEGSNIIAVMAQDVVGNVANVVQIVERDSTPPAVTIASPLDGQNASVPTLNVTVTSESDAIVTVNGVMATKTGTTTFVVTIALREGWNTITAVATDPLGNTALDTISFRYIPPVYVTPSELQSQLDELENELTSLMDDELNDLTAEMNSRDLDLIYTINQTRYDLNSSIGDLDDKLTSNVNSLNSNLMLGLIGVLVALIVAMVIVFMLLSNKIKALGSSGPAPKERKVKTKEIPPPPEEKA